MKVSLLRTGGIPTTINPDMDWAASIHWDKHAVDNGQAAEKRTVHDLLEGVPAASLMQFQRRCEAIAAYPVSHFSSPAPCIHTGASSGRV